jgi:DNA-binding CsgD family transcriptional regulator/tetratricopeptide (TPR) repeat protein
LLTFEDSARIVLHPLLSEFLIERVRESTRHSTDAIVVPLIDTLMNSRRWDECLVVAEALPGSSTFASAILKNSLQEQLNNGRAATVRRWVALARYANLNDPIVELAEAEIALLAGDFDRALAVGSHVATRRTSRDVRSRAELVAGRAAHLADQRSAAMKWFRAAEASARSRQVRAKAIWGQVIVAHDEETDAFEGTLERFAQANDGTIEHQSRLAHGRVLFALANGDIHEAIEGAEKAASLVAEENCDPFARLAALNQLPWMLGYAARYDEAERAASRVIADAEAEGIDFALNDGLLAKARALVGMRRFADARDVLNRVMSRLRSEPDAWTSGDLAISQARIQISIGDLDRARDHLAFDLDPRAPLSMRAEFDAYRALIEAASGRLDNALAWVERSFRSARIEARALAWMTEDVISLERQCDERRRLSGIDRVLKSGCLDAIVIACRAQPALVRRIVIEGTHREALRALLLSCGDRPLAGAAGLEIPRVTRPAARLSPRELEVYELMIQGRTNPEIAKSLFITESTTKVHVRHILGKLGVRSRVEAVRAWRPAGPSDSSVGDAD